MYVFTLGKKDIVIVESVSAIDDKLAYDVNVN
jgi:hypothetical protein